MSDRKTIYLDDAIDALEKIPVREFKKTDGLIDALVSIGQVYMALKQLPSAQPEAKPPKWVAEDRFVKNSFTVYPHCPQCNADVRKGQCYCMICGQHIDWSEDDG